MKVIKEGYNSNCSQISKVRESVHMRPGNVQPGHEKCI